MLNHYLLLKRMGPKHILATGCLLLAACLSGQPSFLLGTSLDGFGHTAPTATQTLARTYEKWEKVATGTGQAFLVSSNSFADKWQNGTFLLNTIEQDIFFGDGASPNGVFSFTPVVGRTYIFKLRRDDAINNGYTNLRAIVMETPSAPVTITNIIQSPAGSVVPPNQIVTVQAHLSAAPSPSENVFLRYTTDDFETYGSLIAPSSFASANEPVFQIPGFGIGVTVKYYLLTTTLPLSAINGDELATDLATINLASGAEYVLPAALSSFTATPLRQAVQLRWATAAEVDNAYFAIERSATGHDFREVGRVAGNGTTTDAQQYAYTDEAPLRGTSYYRLRQVDYHGASEVHKTVAVEMRTAASPLRLAPIPAQERLTVQMPEPAAQDTELLLLNMQGQILLRTMLPAGQATLDIDVSALPAGHYYLRAGQAAQRFVKGA